MPTITAVRPLENGLLEREARDLWEDIAGFAAYSFNKSHSLAYSLLSFQTAWLKTNFPVEFYAAALSLLKEDKLPALLKDANDFGITLQMPDINYSSGEFEILNDTTLCIPFDRIKGISENTRLAILTARTAGPFTSKADLTKRVERRKCNVRHVETLDKVGAFARIEEGQLPANHPDRIRDQRELIPGLISDAVPIHRPMATDRDTKVELVKIVAEYRTAHADDGVQVKPTLGKTARFMAISDAPTSGEEKIGSMSYYDNFAWVASALSDAGLARSDAYWTALIKRPKAGKQVSPAEIETYKPYLMREIDLLKPPIIVLLGSQTVRNFFPDFKGKASDNAGKIIYSKDHDANFVIGFNPGEIYHDSDKQVALNEVFLAVNRLL